MFLLSDSLAVPQNKLNNLFNANQTALSNLSASDVLMVFSKFDCT